MATAQSLDVKDQGISKEREEKIRKWIEEKDYNQLISHYIDTKDYHNAIKYALLAGDYQTAAGLYEGELKDYKSASKYYALSSDPHVKWKAGVCYARLEDYPSAIKVFLELEDYSSVAACFYAMGNWEKVIENLLKASDTIHYKYFHYEYLAKCYERLGNQEQAKQYYKRAAEKSLEVNLYKLYYAAAEFYQKAGDFRNARKYYKKAYRHYQNQGRYIDIADCLMALGKEKEAKKYYRLAIDEILESQDSNKGLDYYFVATSYKKMGNEEKSREYYDLAIRALEKEKSYTALADIYEELSDCERAIEYLRKARDLISHWNPAAIEYRIGDCKANINNFRGESP